MKAKKTSFTIVKKNKYPNAPWYVRRRITGEPILDVNLETTDKKDAETELMRVKVAQAELERTGSSGDALDALSVRRKQAKEPVSVPGGVLDRWENWCRVEGLRETSIHRYGKAVRYLLKDVSLEDLTKEKVVALMASTVNLKANTRHSYVNALTSLFKFLERDDLRKALPRVKVEVGDRTVWTRRDMWEIICNVSTKKAQRTLEYKEYFQMMSCIGSRQGETYALKWEDISESDGTVHFKAEYTKARKERWCPLPTDLWALLESRRGKPTESLWPNIGRDQATRFEALSYAIKKAGVKPGGLHTFRHSVATLLYRECKDIVKVAQLLGHSPQVSLKYYQAARGIDELRELVDK